MRSSDVEAVGELLGDASDGTGRIVQETHQAIAARTFDALGPVAAPVRVVHDGIAGAVYRGVRGGLKAASVQGSRTIARHQPQDGDATLTDRPVGGLLAGAINGIWGDYLAERRSPLALGMEVRSAGSAVPATPHALASAYPEATPRIAIFVHGLCETDQAWRGLPPRKDALRRPTFGDQLLAGHEVTPVYLRYNSGLRISANGRALAALIEDLVAHWPVAVSELLLIGHSMGGLVARSACHYGAEDGATWTTHVRHVFCLGAPHLGADLEKGVHLIDWALAKAPETRAIGSALRRRSVGVKDLRFGAIAEHDWDGHDPDEFLRDRCLETPFLDGATYYFVGARLGGPAGHLLGDLLVRMPSASGQSKTRSIPFEIENGHELPGLSHFDLLGHPAVYAQIDAWLQRAQTPAKQG